MPMPSRQHSDFEAWQADVMRTLVDAGPLATSYFASTERHQESLRTAGQLRTWDTSAKPGGRGSLLSLVRQRGGAGWAIVAGRIQAMRLTEANRRPLPPPVSAETS